LSVYEKYDLVVGLEIHIRLQTKSKLFCPDPNQYGAEPNENVSAISTAHPGILPFVNKSAVEMAIKAGLSTNCTIANYCYFDRKHYNYPDLPKGFQTTQDTFPICTNGWLDVEIDETIRKVQINRIHMEEDAGKSIHDLDPKNSFIDLNRAGTPLLELVTEPDIDSPELAHAFFSSIKQIVECIGICDGNMQEGSLRCDANVSIKPKGQKELGTRVEIKNLNSLRFVKKAVAYEFKRQVEMVEKGETIKQVTVGFDSKSGATFPQREKEMLHDYRYFPEPDLLPMSISQEWIDEIQSTIPPLPQEIKAELINQHGLSTYDAGVLIANISQYQFYKATSEHTKHFKALSNWITGPIRSHLNENNSQFSDFDLAPTTLAELVNKVEGGTFSFSIGKMVLSKILNNPNTSVDNGLKMLNLQPENQSEIESVIDELKSGMPRLIRKRPMS